MPIKPPEGALPARSFIRRLNRNGPDDKGEASALDAGSLGSVLFEGDFGTGSSLSLVNQEIASALIEQGVNVAVLPVGSGEALSADAADGAWRKRVLSAEELNTAYDVHLRNAWPIRTDNMLGRRNGLVCWAWEETDLPASLSARFERDLDFILTTANFVTEAVRRSCAGLAVWTVGNGADHVLKYEQHRTPAAQPKRLLHVSTCLPRKAPDVLVEAFARAFPGRTDVELYIKTTPNPHNQIQAIVASAKQRHPAMPNVVVDQRFITAPELAALYTSSAGLVLASRGEGFGLPLAESMMLGMPVITCRKGAQADFCTDETAFLVKSRPVRAVAHVSSGYGLWEEPDPQDLALAMRALVDDPAKAQAIAKKASAHARKTLRWQDVARRIIGALSQSHAAPAPCPKYELVSTWNEPCGIATYASSLVNAEPLKGGLAHIWARRLAPGTAPIDESIEKTPQATRVWGYDSHALAKFGEALRQSARAPVIWVQHHPGQMSNADMAFLLPAMRTGGRRVIVTLHNTKEVLGAAGSAWLGNVDRLIVHSAMDAELLGEQGYRAEVIPHGVDQDAIQADPDRETFTVGTFGFLTPHKNIDLLIGAVALARETNPQIRLRCATAVQKNTNSQAARARVEALIRYYGLEDHVTREYAFISEQGVKEFLAPCKLLAFVYAESNESASGAARIAIALNRPMLISTSKVLEDLQPFSFVAPRLEIESVAEALLSLAADDQVLQMLNRPRNRFADAHAWSRIAPRISTVLAS